VNQTQLALPPTVLRAARPDDEQLLADLLGGLSPTTSFHRFMAGVASPGPELIRGLLQTDPDRGAVLALRPHPGGTRAVGHASWVVTPRGAADLAVVVADAEQGRGVGSALFAAAAERAAAAGATSVHLDVHPENRRVAAALRRRLGGSAVSWRHGLLSVEGSLADVVGRLATRLAAPAA